ncbi:relaxase/mobilization nuclease domain-containing protein [Mesorhizobium sp. PL10]
MFGRQTDDADVKDFAERCANDRHHFRFIISPQDAVDMSDLKTFTRDLMAQAVKDLGTNLDWLAADHWNTDNPHIHIILRGRVEDGQDLVISRDYIKNGMRGRAQDLITQELGPRNDREIRHALHQQIEAEHWTVRDRQLVREMERLGAVDVAPIAGRKPDEYLAVNVGRLRKLERLGLAAPIGAGQWTMVAEAEATLRALGERGDIIKRMHRTLAEHGLGRYATDQVVLGEASEVPIIGRHMERGLHDELRASAYAIVDGIDGRTHYLCFQNLDAAGDSAPASIVELRRCEDEKGRSRVALAVRSDLPIEDQVHADGATWLDRQLVAHGPNNLGEGGFAQQVKQALENRTQHLVEQGLARREADRVIVARNLIAALRVREIDALGEQLSAGTGLPFTKATEGGQIAGIYRQRFSLASGRFAMIDDGLGFKLVPWSPALDKHLGGHLAGVMRPEGGVDWTLGRKRGLGL